MQEFVILVNERDQELGLMEMEAHHKGVLHRAFSVFLFNTKGEMLLQQRAYSKYHSPGLWTNTCCSHPRKNESNLEAAQRRLKEEMGMESRIEEIFSFIYKADVGQGLTEHELDHVFVGYTDAQPVINTLEAASYRYAKPAEVKTDMQQHPENYTVWFRIAFEEVYNYFNNNKLDTI